MFEFNPYITNDGSVGLYNKAFKDIYHSASGAFTESIEKFILPVNFAGFADYNNLNILDICYGIGYNTKALLSFIFDTDNILEFLHVKNSNAQIYTNKQCNNTNLLYSYNSAIYDNNSNYSLTRELSPCNNAIYSNNKIAFKSLNNSNNNVMDDANGSTILNTHTRIYDILANKNIHITAIDIDKTLVGLSPFIKTGCNNLENQVTNFDYKIVEKYINPSADVYKPVVSPQINLFLLSKLFSEFPELYTDEVFKSIVFNEKYLPFFDAKILAVFQEILKVSDSYKPILANYSNLHNIYYQHVSNNYKMGCKPFDYSNLTFEFKFDDARKIVQQDDKIYDLIFLDAFSPTKCPCLWSVDFFKLLYDHLSKNGVLLTYSSSASVRNALLNAGYHIGKIYSPIQNKFTGTLAVKNPDYIVYKLNDYELGLLNTTAGIFYRDESLIAENAEIINKYSEERKNSALQSSSKYNKLFKNRIL